MSLDPDDLLPDHSCLKFQQLLQEYNQVFDPKITGYNSAAGPIQATVNIGPVQPPHAISAKGTSCSICPTNL